MVSDLLDDVRHKLAANPPTTPFFINALPGTELRLVHAIGVTVSYTSDKHRVRARFADADLEAYGEDGKGAVLNLREVIVRTFIRLERQQVFVSRGVCFQTPGESVGDDPETILIDAERELQRALVGLQSIRFLLSKGRRKGE